MGSQLRSDLWVSAFVRRHNDLGRLCVVSRRGDPIAGQVFIEVDHLNGTISLYTPAPSVAREDSDAGRLFQRRFDHAEPAAVSERIQRELGYDPDLWVLSLEMRGDDLGIEVANI